MIAEEYTSYQKQAMWEMINDMDLCPQCMAKGSMVKVSKEGLGSIIKCKDCGREFWFSPSKRLGAYPVDGRKEVITKWQLT